MTVPNTVNRNDYVGNGTASVYPYTFKVQAKSELLVTVRDTSDVEVTLAITTDYTVSGVGDANGGNVTLVDSGQSWLDGDGDLLTGYAITIRRNPALTQTTSIANNGPFFPRTHEDAFDHFVMIDQKQQDEIDRSMKLPESIDPAGFDMTLPATIQTDIGAMMLVNSTGDGWETGPDANAIADAEANANAAAASAAAASASEVNAAQSETDAAASESTATTQAGNASTSATNAATSASNAATSESNAATSESNAAASAAAAAASAAAGTRFRNRLINPAFSIDQRRLATVPDDTYFADRWYGLTETANITCFRDVNPEDGYSDAIRLRQTNAGTQRMGFAQIIEGINGIDLRAKDTVISPRVKVSADFDIRYAICEWTGTEDSVTSDIVADWTSPTYTPGNFFLGANLSVVAVGVETVTAAGGWTTLADLTGLVSGSMNNLIAFVWTEDAAPLNFELSCDYIQLEQGTASTAPERRSIQDERTMCHRYFWKTFPETTVPAQNAGLSGALYHRTPWQVSGYMGSSVEVVFPAIMRQSPSITYYNPAAANARWRNVDDAADYGTDPVTDQSNPWGVTIQVVNTGSWTPTQTKLFATHFTSEAEL